jgi:hypothetical protein
MVRCLIIVLGPKRRAGVGGPLACAPLLPSKHRKSPSSPGLLQRSGRMRSLAPRHRYILEVVTGIYIKRGGKPHQRIFLVEVCQCRQEKTKENSAMTEHWCYCDKTSRHRTDIKTSGY